MKINCSLIWGAGSSLRCRGGLSSSQVYAVGEDKTVLFFDGYTWRQMDTGEPDINDLMESGLTSYAIAGVWESLAADLFAVADIGKIRHSRGSSCMEIGISYRFCDVGKFR